MYRAIVLAAGESKRMGVPKLLLPYRDGSILRAVLEAVRRSRIDEILVVAGANRHEIEAEAHGLADRTVFHPSWARGMLSSIQAGLQALPGDTRAALVFLGDQPSIESGVVDAVLDALERTERSIVVPVHDGRRGHPVAIDLRWRDEILRLDPEQGLRALLRAHPEEVLEVPVDCPGILRDIDTPEDYREEVRRARRGEASS